MNSEEQSLETINQLIADRQKEIRDLQFQAYKVKSAARDRGAEAVAAKLAKGEKYKTKNGLTIHSLRQAGNEVSVAHIRYAQYPGVVTLVPVPSYMRKLAKKFYPNGGATHITIKNPASGGMVIVSSICHIDDSFDYRMGVKLALDQIDDVAATQLMQQDNLAKVEETIAAEPVTVSAATK
jgi:hypothetical protein